jgi:phosphatidyl-myo-inositol alpha-mannosyltransferase
MAAPPTEPPRVPRRVRHTLVIVAVALLSAGLVVFALTRLDLHRVGHALITASPGWIVLSVALMAFSLVLRSGSWHQVLRAALPDTPVRWAPVIRATMLGVMGSAVFPGRIGEPSRVIVLTRHLPGSRRHMLAVVAGTVFSQTLINLLALAILAVVTFVDVPLGSGSLTGEILALAVPLAIAALVVGGPRLVAFGRRSRWERVRVAAHAIERMLRLARRGLTVFARPRYGVSAIALQLLAWALQWMACYAVILALGLEHETGLAAAAAILLAVNLSAILPATPSNVGVFQAACLVVLAAYGVSAGLGLAYGIILQAVEVVTALALGVPALLSEGVTWRDLRSSAEHEDLEEQAEGHEPASTGGPDEAPAG